MAALRGGRLYSAELVWHAVRVWTAGERETRSYVFATGPRAALAERVALLLRAHGGRLTTYDRRAYTPRPGHRARARRDAGQLARLLRVTYRQAGIRVPRDLGPILRHLVARHGTAGTNGSRLAGETWAPVAAPAPRSR
jgi:hypothetical protein